MDNIVVICQSCLHFAPYDQPDGNNQWGVWHWHEPCPYCGADNWASHDITRDIKTGRPIDQTK